jgi:hypothetical protein
MSRNVNLVSQTTSFATNGIVGVAAGRDAMRGIAGDGGGTTQVTVCPLSNRRWILTMASGGREGDGRCAGQRGNRRKHAPPAPRRRACHEGTSSKLTTENRPRVAWINAQRFFVDQDRGGAERIRSDA